MQSLAQYSFQDIPIAIPAPLNTIPDQILPSHIVVPRCHGNGRQTSQLSSKKSLNQNVFWHFYFKFIAPCIQKAKEFGTFKSMRSMSFERPWQHPNILISVPLPWSMLELRLTGHKVYIHFQIKTKRVKCFWRPQNLLSNFIIRVLF